ncbi:MAG TPA: adenylate/guanylate cyclase domain-containing protein [Actinomycetota bacterium]
MRECPSCGSPNPDGARFCASCGASLVPACGQCGAELPPGARFCPSCGTPVPDDVPVPTGSERKLVTVLFADVTGSTGLGERLDPERLQELMATYFSAMREEIEAEGGTVEKFIGDAVMAAFGVPAAHEDDPARALRAALRMRRRLTELNHELERRYGVTLQIRTGVNTGEVLAAVSPKPVEPMVTGDAVNVAARLEQAAEPGSIVVAERTARAARGFGYRELGPRELRGKQGAVAAVLLEAQTAEPVERGVPGLRAPMVGRDQELALLRTLYGRAVAEGHPNLVTIYGDPGVGKSRLVREFLAWAEAQTPAPYVTFGRCLPYGEGITYWPLAEILKRHAGVQDSDPTEAVLEKIGTACDAVLEADPSIDAGRTCRAIAYTAGLEFPGSPMAGREPRQIRAEMHAAWRSFFSALSTSAPVIAVIEDIHWADDAMLDLLEDLADRVLGPVVLVCPARPELLDARSGWGGGRRNFSSVSLEPLTAGDAGRLVGHLLTVNALPAGLRARILERAEGNPFFLEEIVRHLIDEGRIVRDGDRWRATERVGEVQIPDTVQAVLAARIDLLGAEEKRTLQRAAVVGRTFWPGPVRRLLNGDGDRVHDTLERLAERELVLSRMGSAFAGEPEFAFKHILTREVAYESLPRRERAQAHAAVAGWIEGIAAERSREFVELLAYHYLQAYQGAMEDPTADPSSAGSLRARAFASLLEAAEQAHRRFAIEKALKLAEKAERIADDPLERATALEQIGVTAISDYRGDLAWRCLREAADLRLEHAPDDHEALARVCARAVETPSRWPGSMREVPSEDEITRYIRIGFENAGDRDGESLVRLLSARAFGPFSFGPGRSLRPGEYEAAREDGRRATEMAVRIGRPDLASAALDATTSAGISLGFYGGEIEFVQRRLELADDLDNPWEVGDIFAMGAWTAGYLGDFPRAIELGSEGVRRTEGAEAIGLMIHSLCWVAFARFALGDWSAVTDELLPRVRRLLGERADEPPYFTAPLLGPAAFVKAARGDSDADGLEELIGRMGGRAHNRSVALAAWRAWIRVRRGEVDGPLEELARIDRAPASPSRPLTIQLWAEAMADGGRFEGLPGFLQTARTFAEAGGLRALDVHLDALEGRGAVAAGQLVRGEELLLRARDGFDRLGATWEVARADLSLAEGLAKERPADARERLDGAQREFERVGSLWELRRSGALWERLG